MRRFAQPGETVQSCCFPRCDAPPNDRLDLPLCANHCMSVYKHVVQLLDPEFVRDYLSTEARRGPRPVAPERSPGYVYFVRLGDRVKIGHSLTPQYRLKQIPHEEVLAVIEGSSSDEKRAHRKFAHLRTTGEWFKAEQDLLDFTKSLPRAVLK